VFRGDNCGDVYGSNVVSVSYNELPPLQFGAPRSNISFVPQCVSNGFQINVLMYVEWVSYPVAILYDVLPSLGECEAFSMANDGMMSSVVQCAWSDGEDSVTTLSFPNDIEANVELSGHYVVMEIYSNAQCEGGASAVVLTLLDTCLDTGTAGSLPQFIWAHYNGRWHMFFLGHIDDDIP
jgi:hypothetical protein